MQKAEQHGKPDSPFGSGVVQFPETPDETVEVKEEVQAEETQQEESALITPEEEKGVALPDKDLNLPTIIDYMDEGTVKLLTEDQKKALSRGVRGMGYWMDAVMICEDHNCDYKAKCPLFIAKIPRPRGKDCPVELTQTYGYKTMLMSRLAEQDREDPFIEIQINDLVHLMMLEARAHGKFGIDGGMIEVDDVRGFNPISGEHVVSKVVHRAIGVIERMGKEKRKILSKLLATPQDRAKADRDGVYDRSRKAAEIGDRIAKVAEKRKKDMKREVYLVERLEDGEIQEAQVIDVPSE